MKKVLSVTLVLVMMLMAVGSTVFAAPYKPSPEQYDEINVIDNGGLMITSYGSNSGRSSQFPIVKTSLNAAMKEIKDAGSWSDLCSGVSAQMEKMKSASSDPAAKDCTVDDLVLESLFDVSLVEDNSMVDFPSSKTFKIRTSLKKNDVFVILHTSDRNSPMNWTVITDYVLDENGDLTITLDSAGPVAILKYTISSQGSGRTSPKTEGEEAAEDILTDTADAAPQKREFQVNFGSISGIVMVVFGVCLIAYAGIAAKKNRK